MEEINIANGKKPIYSAKSDLKSVFRILPLVVSKFCLLIMKVVSPTNGKTYYFVDKCYYLEYQSVANYFRIFLVV